MGTTKPTLITILQKSPLNITTGCWDYTGSLDCDGYPSFVNLCGKRVRPTRAVYQYIKGTLLPDWVVTQTCGNKKCLNPEHLKAGERAKIVPRPPNNTLVTILMQTKIDLKTNCWEWLGLKSKDGYGKVSQNSRTYSVHRLVYSLINGEIPKEVFVCHRCDNPSCCNPEHLFLGNHQENMDDMYSKGRGAFCRIESKQKQEIIDMLSSGMSRKTIAAKLGVSVTTITRVRSEFFPTNPPRLPRKTKVSNKEFEEVFESAALAAQYFKVSSTAVTQAVKRGGKCCGFCVEYV
jgi:hypothetical protein